MGTFELDFPVDNDPDRDQFHIMKRDGKIPRKFDGDLIRFLKSDLPIHKLYYEKEVKGAITSVDYAIRLAKAFPKEQRVVCGWTDSIIRGIVECFCVELFTAKEPTVESIKAYINACGGKEYVDMVSLSNFTKYYDLLKEDEDVIQGKFILDEFVKYGDILYQKMVERKIRAREDYIQKLMEEARNI